MPYGTERRRQEPKSFQDAELSFVALLLHRAGVTAVGEYSEEEEGNYYFAAGKYYQASWGELQTIQEAGVSVGEIPAVLHVSRHGGIGSEDVAKQRVSGDKWSEILSRYCVRPETLYVRLKTGIGKATTKPYRFYRDTARDAWKARPFTDENIVNLANLKFASEFYRTSPDTIVALLSNGWTFAAIHGELQSKSLAQDRSRFVSTAKCAGQLG